MLASLISSFLTFKHLKKEELFMGREQTIGELWLRGEKAFSNPKALEVLQVADTANSAQIIARMQGFSYMDGRSVHAAMRLLVGRKQDDDLDGTHLEYKFSKELEWLAQGFTSVKINGVSRLKPDKDRLILMIIGKNLGII